MTAHDAAERMRLRAEDLLRRVQAQVAAVAASERRAELQDRLAKAGIARQSVETTSAGASVGPDDDKMERLRTLSADLTTARALRDSTATRLVMRYAPGQDGGIRHGEASLDDGMTYPIHADTLLHIKDVGELTIHPGEGPKGLADVARAEGDLAEALSILGAASLDEAIRAHRMRKEAKDRLTQLRGELAALAPKGIEDLQRQLAELPAVTTQDAADLPTENQAETDLNTTRQRMVESAVTREAARERLDHARTAKAGATVRQEAAAERLESACTALDRLATQDDAELARQANTAEEMRGEAEAELARIRTTAPDISATEAALKRAQSVDDAARNRIGELRPAIAALNERIAGNSGDAVEEQLQEVEEKLGLARAHLARVEREVKVLQRLQSALEASRSEARDRYFEPVAGELRPLLHLLWPEAELNWADDTLLPQSLIRHGQEEAVDILSGGTQEQLAFLVRLAFARLLAKSGRHAPVILDDALVFTDDDRIERMFDALHRQARDLQIIVLSCRQRAFRELGGKTLQMTVGQF